MKKTGNFELIGVPSGGNARRGRFRTAHGVIETPVFMPVGTRGTVKGITPQQLRQTGSVVVLANTYHLLIRPGVETVQALGGLHKLMSWDGPILTDSGGYQVFSLSALSRVSDDGVEFASHIDGAKMYLDAKTVTEAQNRLGADIIMCFDECVPFPCEHGRLEKAVERTIRWAGQCLQAHRNDRQLLFGIVQGGTDRQLRRQCVQALAAMDFEGYAIGGLGVGEGHKQMVETVNHTVPLLPEGRPRYLMGAGTPADIVAAVGAGVDMFDCVLPTRNGRNAYAFTMGAPVRLRNNSHALEAGPIDAECDCYCCGNFSRGALRHFFNAGEMLGPILVSLHNIRFYQRLMEQIRQRIESGIFEAWAGDFISKQAALQQSDIAEDENYKP